MKKFGDNSKSYPAEMRTQLWPLCCGARIISGFKGVTGKPVDEIVKMIETTLNDYIPDHQVFAGETMQPKLIFLTLNQGQAGSKTILEALDKTGFKLFMTAKPRGGLQHFYVRDESKTFELKAA